MVECLSDLEAVAINYRVILKTLICFVLVFQFWTAARAITWPETVRLLKQNNNELLSAQKLLDSSGWTYRRSYSALLPQLSANLSAGSTTVATAAASASYSYGLNANLDLFSASDYFNLRSAYANYQFNQASYDLTAADALFNVRSAFIDLLIAQAGVDLQNKILARRQENSRLIGLRYNSGVEDKGNLMRTQADETSARYNLSSAERSRRLAILNLSQLLSTAVGSAEEDYKFSRTAQPDYESLLNLSPACRAAKYQLEAAQIQQQSTLSEFLPALTLSGSYRRSGGSWPPDVDSSSLSLNVAIPLFPGGANFVDEAINNLKLDKAKEDFAKALKDARFAIVSGYENFDDAQAALDSARTLLDATTERSNIAQEKYINGLLTYDAWDIIENEYITAQVSYLNAQRQVMAAEAAWEKSYGGYVK